MVAIPSSTRSPNERKRGIHICFENGIVDYLDIAQRISSVHHRFEGLFVLVMLAGDRLQVAVFDNERCERVIVKEKGIAVLERVFGSFCEEFSSDLERCEVFQLYEIGLGYKKYSVRSKRRECVAQGRGDLKFVILKFV